MARAPTPYQIQQAMSVAAGVKARLVADDPDATEDHRLLADMIDGESDAFDIVRALIRHSIESQSLADAAKARMDDLRARKDRFERRVEAARNTAFAMLEALEWRERIEEPDFTAAIGKGRMSVRITDELLLPERLVRVKREPDKTAIAAELKDGNIVTGAELSNGSATLIVRTR
jgi:hypothetical protein